MHGLLWAFIVLETFLQSILAQELRLHSYPLDAVAEYFRLASLDVCHVHINGWSIATHCPGKYEEVYVTDLGYYFNFHSI